MNTECSQEIIKVLKEIKTSLTSISLNLFFIYVMIAVYTFFIYNE